MSAAPSISIAVILISCLAVQAQAKRDRNAPHSVPVISPGSAVSLDRPDPYALPHASAAADTTILGAWTFDGGGGGCIAEGWTSVDRTEQLDTFFHVDDFAGLGGGDFGRLVPLEGAQSMWCGARPSTVAPYCGYATLPGYGNHWDQTFETTDCVSVSGPVSVDFLMAWDSEPGYDATALEVMACGGDFWYPIDGGVGDWDGVSSGFLSVAVTDTTFTSSGLRLRFRFESDGLWSDEDGLYDTDGAVILDSLTVSDTTGVALPTETFETEAIGATVTASGNWTAIPMPGYGDFASLFPGATVVQEDPCLSNLSCLWGFFSGSTRTYACGGYPGQPAVPTTNLRGQYLENDIWSPWMPLTGDGNTYELTFDVYRDLDIDAMVFYQWHVRFMVGGCPTVWRDDNFLYFGEEKEWVSQTFEFGHLVEPGATQVQVALGAIDGCQFFFCFGEFCRSHAPLFDNVEVRRIDSNGPAWSVRDVDLFQDNFAADGTRTGTVRADAAIDLLPSNSPDIRPGDSVVVHVGNPEGTLATDPYTGQGAAVYTYIHVRPPGQAGKSGAALSGDPSRWPLVDSLDVNGDRWYCLRMDSALAGAPAPDTTFCVDLNDSLFTPGDTVFYVFGAVADQPAVETTYYSRFTGTTDDMAYAFANPLEFTCLPTQEPGVYHPTTYGPWLQPALYVDFHDGHGSQAAFDEAFDHLGITGAVDRYDVLSPSSMQGNSPGGRVVDVSQQLSPVYRKIIWSTGDLETGVLGDGSTVKYDDAGMLETFLDELTSPGGVYFTGDDLAEEWSGLAGSAALLGNAYIQHALDNGDHVAAGYGVSPRVIATDTSFFFHNVPDSLVAFGGCPVINDFDVLIPQGNAVTQMTYESGPGAAIVSQRTTNPHIVSAGVVLSGFDFAEVQDVHDGGVPEHPARHLFDILLWLCNGVATDVADVPAFENSLAQNVPNPFNPSTVIEFTVRERAPVTLRVYNVRGQLVKTLVDDTRAPDITHTIAWDGRNDAGERVASGVYFYRLVTKGFTRTRKMVVLK